MENTLFKEDEEKLTGELVDMGEKVYIFPSLQITAIQ